MTAIEPTVGRILWFVPGRRDPLFVPEKTQIFAGIVCGVLPDGYLNLGVWDGNGNHYGRMRVRLLQPEDEVGDSDREMGYCVWMPYQVGQASKAESLEKELKEFKDSRPVGRQSQSSKK